METAQLTFFFHVFVEAGDFTSAGIEVRVVTGVDYISSLRSSQLIAEFDGLPSWFLKVSEPAEDKSAHGDRGWRMSPRFRSP